MANLEKLLKDTTSVPIINEPPLDRILRVEQRAVGYMTPQSAHDYLETIYLTTCVGVHYAAPKIQVLAHIDGEKHNGNGMEYLTQQLCDYIREMNFWNGRLGRLNRTSRYDLFCSRDADTDEVDSVKEILMENNFPSPNIYCSHERATHVLFDKSGKPSFLYPLTLAVSSVDNALLERLAKYSGLKCQNSGIILSPQLRQGVEIPRGARAWTFAY